MFMDTSMSMQSQAKDSLILPHNATLGVYNIDNWRIYDAPTEGNKRLVCRLVAELKIDGYENWSFQWCAEEADILDPLIGNGSVETWREQKINDFRNNLLTLKEEYLFKIQNGIKTASISTSDIYNSFGNK